MEEPFVLRPLETSCSWVLHPPTDPYGDGYIWAVRSEISDEGMTAETSATMAGRWAPENESLGWFFQSLADDWRGWEGGREWRSLEGEMEIDAHHDGRGHVAVGVMLRRARQAYADDAWSARMVFMVEAGEEMTRLAADLRDFLGRKALSGCTAIRTAKPADRHGPASTVGDPASRSAAVTDADRQES
ncbi:DUF6228 family protein [Micromonospora arborensis]|uniref:DUF6228 family protein n=1 Tax=Micromonospora arborensis TaxID=2116518 RepID=UPI0033EABE2E